MKQIVKYSILPGVVVSVVNALFLWVLGTIRILGKGSSIDDDLGWSFWGCIFGNFI